MNLETKIAKYVQLRQQIEELENQKKALVSEVLELLPRETPTVSIPGYRIKRASMLSIKTSLASAKQFGAVKMKEVVDKEKIKQLYREGHNPPDVSEIHFIQVYTEALILVNSASSVIHETKNIEEKAVKTMNKLEHKCMD